MDNAKKHIFDVSVVICMFVCGVISVFQCKDLPGLYLDAVNPDYYGTYLLHPNNYSAVWSMPNLGIGLLAQIYHGILTVPGEMLSELITGSTSLIQLRITNSIYGSLISVAIYMIMRRVDINRWLSFIVSAICAVSPGLVSAYRTQYYIELPCSLLVMLSIYTILGYFINIKNKSVWRIVLAGALLGLSFYGYFNCVFFLPGFLLVIAIISRKKHSIIINIVRFMVGYGIGIFPSVIGYTMIDLVGWKSISDNRKRFLLLVVAILYITTLICIFIMNEKKKNGLMSICGTALVASVGCILIKATKVMSGYIDSLNVAGTDGGLGYRISALIKCCKEAIVASSLEHLVLYREILRFKNLPFGVFVGVTLIVLAIAIFCVRSSKAISNEIILYLSCLCGCILYLLCSMPMITRMTGQHFVPFLPIMILMIGLGLGGVGAFFKGNKIAKALIAFICVLLLTLNIYNQNIIWKTLNNATDWMNPLYSNAIEQLANAAKDKNARGEREYYVFPEWGMALGFEYLTQNKIALADGIYEPFIESLYDKGYNVLVCYWDENNKDEYIEALNSALGNEISFVSDVQEASFGDDIQILEVKATNN